MHHRNPSGLGALICAYIAGAIAQAVTAAESLAAAGIDKSVRHLTIGDVAHQKVGDVILKQTSFKRRQPREHRGDAGNSRAVRHVERREVEGDG